MQNDKLLSAYEQMLTRVKDSSKTSHTLSERIDRAKEKALEFEELTREEAEKLAYYVKRDLHDAAHTIVETEHELADWLRFDLELLEERFIDLFSVMEDPTRTELDHLAEQAKLASEWTSGEVTGAGTLYCASCNHSLQFYQPDFIPACPNCGSTLFLRDADSLEE
ncbi:zinc ribbon-containing protein [Candidatus Albibeggiatoa sp. nov. NOAA]|uniref:zinc ribbon-containing protein n=1 Tax=Candidatus Albibeggiatoa sp. nov. NOAA TaxID=3162724 RepID=UPI0032F3CC83|nr:zinc ribbon-containing protein [Thiotrichaceae bacterium]